MDGGEKVEVSSGVGEGPRGEARQGEIVERMSEAAE